MIPYSRQSISEADIEAVVGVLRSDFLTQGPAVPRFEEAVAEYCGAGHAVAVSSATAALHLACRALGLGPGDSLWTSPNTFVASANCARYCGASVDFVDIDPRTYNLSVDRLREKLEVAERQGRLPKVVEPVHFAGCPCDMAEIRTLADQYGFRILEDASHALGASYRDEKIGACGFSDIAVFSFHPVKMITTGEGGMAVTQDPDLADRMRLLRSHGITRDPDRMTHEPDGPWYYQQVELGYHYRMTDLQAALGYSQLLRLDEFVDRRNQLAQRYDQLLADLPVQLPTVPADRHSSFHLYPILVDPARRHDLFVSLRRAGYGVNVHYIPVPTQPEIAASLSSAPELPATEDYYRQEISIPLHAALTDQQQDSFAATFCDLFA